MFPSDVNHRYDFHLFFDVTGGNPNGDPDADNKPRIDPMNGYGYVTDVCLKRKIRNTVMLLAGERSGFDIFMRQGSILENSQKEAYEKLGVKSKTERKKGESEVDAKKKVREEMCRRFYDSRMFGAVGAGQNYPVEKITGPLQINGMSYSVEPLAEPMQITITRGSITNEKDSEKQDGANQTMGHKWAVSYALYHARGSFSPGEARKTFVTPEDLDVLWKSMLIMFDHDRSASRGYMSLRRLFVLEHESPLGCMNAARFHDLFGAVKRNPAIETPVRFEDYTLPTLGALQEQLKPYKGVVLYELTPEMAYESLASKSNGKPTPIKEQEAPTPRAIKQAKR